MNAYFVKPRNRRQLGFFKHGGPAIVDPLEPGPGLGLTKTYLEALRVNGYPPIGRDSAGDPGQIICGQDVKIIYSY